MKTMFVLRAASMVISLGVGSAYAGDGEGPVANTQFTEIPGVVSQAPVQNVSPEATAQNDQATQTYVVRSNRGTCLFAPNANGGANS
jgi:hypothetical protein